MISMSYFAGSFGWLHWRGATMAPRPAPAFTYLLRDFTQTVSLTCVGLFDEGCQQLFVVRYAVVNFY